MLVIDEALGEGNFLGAIDLDLLAAFQRCHELGSAQKAVGGARVEPPKAAAEDVDVELAALQIGPVDVSDLHLAAGRRLEAISTTSPS